MISLLIIVIAIIISYEIIIGLGRYNEKTVKYNIAKKVAEATGKQFIVIGNPDNGFMDKLLGPSYSGGDVLIDIVPSKKFNTTVMDVREFVKTRDIDSCVIFESCVLEYLPDNLEVQKEFKRIAGDNLYQVRFSNSIVSKYYFLGIFTQESCATYPVL